MARTNSNEIIAAIDIGTSKIVVLIAEINQDSDLKIIGTGTHQSSGLKKGVVVNIESTVDSIAQAIEQAEKFANCEINTVFAGIAGSHVRSYDGHGFVRINSGEVEYNDELVTRGILIEEIELDLRGSWVITVRPSIKIKLGEENTEERFERFLTIWDQSLIENFELISYIDLRYSEGFVIKRKNQ